MPEPITASLRPYTWSDQESVAYEAAIEAINAVVGAYNARITREEARPVAEQDGAAIARWRQECGACQRRREGLEPTNHEQIATVRREYTGRLDDLLPRCRRNEGALMTHPEASRYELPAEENQYRFRGLIVPDLLAGRDPQEAPAAVILVGQPGAGKTRIAQLIGERLNERGGFVEIDSDLYKPYHPAYDEIMRTDDRMMALHTGPDGRAWMRHAHEYAREHRLNVLIHETAQNPPHLARVVQTYRDHPAGYRPEVTTLGVSEAMSRQGILHRYLQQVQDRGQGRLTVPEKATASYSGIAEFADLVDRDRLADFVAVYRRGEHRPRYSNALNVSGQWEKTPKFRQNIETERTRRWTVEESMGVHQVQETLRTGLSPDFEPQLDRIEVLATPLLHPDARRPGTAPAPPHRSASAQDATAHSANARPTPETS